MKRRRFLELPLLAFGMAHERGWALVQDEKIENPYVKTIAWFKAMFRPLEELAEIVDRLRLLSYLRDLQRVCDDMINDKGEIASLLAQKPLLRDDLAVVLERLRVTVNLTRTRVKRVRSVLREEFSKKGEDVSEELSDNLVSRKSWVQELEAKIRSASDEDLSEFAKRAKESREALKEVNMKLSELSKFLSRQR